MTPGRQLVDLCLLTAGYWAVDFLLRRDAFLRLCRVAGSRAAPLAMALWMLPCLALAPFWTWDHVPQGHAFRFLSAVLAALLAWQAASRDIDPVAGGPHSLARLLVVAAAAGTCFSPALLLTAVFLFTTPFALWQHHATLPMRLVQALAAHACLASALGGTGLFADSAAAVFFLFTIAISHYFITALAKGLLGPKWYSWATDNRLHHIAASAYSWGWARFLPWALWHKVVLAVKAVEKPLQAGAFAIELLSPLALLHPTAAIALCAGWAAFHLGVFLLSGLLFWDWILADLALAAFVSMLQGTTALAFGPAQVIAALAFMAAFPLRHKLWKPMPLGWFDTPFTQRIHWRVRGESGAWYGLYNDFMCPHERLYGRVNGCFLAPVPVITYHLGEVWKPELRDAIRAAGPVPARLDQVRERFGITPTCETRAANHRAYLRKFFHALNRGARKHVLPPWLRWLKAPGDQIFYWGDLPAYRRQEKVSRVTLHYREEYYDGKELRRLRDEFLVEIDIEAGDPPGPARELTPKELDDFLLGHAAGRLIDLPGFGGGYVRGDDGKSSHLPDFPPARGMAASRG